ncbi:MAG TPA: hypothetical protein VJH23_04330 [archaeon]|nr:hypothetical protein [archaeon]
MRKDREQLIEEIIDSGNKIIGRIVFTQDYLSFEAFSIGLISIINEKPAEIIRFDCSIREKVNVHRFYNNPPTKHYLDLEKTPETALELWNIIRANWHEYLSKYKENHKITDKVI